PLHSSAGAFHDALYFIKCRHRRISRSGHGESAMRASAIDGPIRALLVEEAVDKAGSERIPAANAVEDFQVWQRLRFVKRAFVIADRAPVVDGRRLGVAQRRADGL